MTKMSRRLAAAVASVLLASATAHRVVHAPVLVLRGGGGDDDELPLPTVTPRAKVDAAPAAEEGQAAPANATATDDDVKPVARGRARGRTMRGRSRGRARGRARGRGRGARPAEHAAPEPLEFPPPALVDLLQWRDPARSGYAFAAGNALFAALCFAPWSAATVVGTLAFWAVLLGAVLTAVHRVAERVAERAGVEAPYADLVVGLRAAAPRALPAVDAASWAAAASTAAQYAAAVCAAAAEWIAAAATLRSATATIAVLVAARALKLLGRLGTPAAAWVLFVGVALVPPLLADSRTAELIETLSVPWRQLGERLKEQVEAQRSST